jgi:hypothetical protein
MQARFFYTGDLDYIDPWRARVFTNLLSGSVFSHEQWGGIFFGLVCGTYILLDRSRSALLMLVTLGAVHAAYALPDGMGMKAWDLPAMWMYATLCLGMARRSAVLIVATSLIGIGFKETALLGAVALLFWEGWSRRRRVWSFIAVLLAGLAIRAGFDAVTGNPVLRSLDFMELNATGNILTEFAKSHLGWNIGWLLLKQPLTPILLNGGLLVVLFVLPGALPHIRAWRAIGLAFIAGNLIAGRISEWRIFLELVPPTVWMLVKSVEGEHLPAGKEQAGSPRLVA